jgi:hypothetical protein
MNAPPCPDCNANMSILLEGEDVVAWQCVSCQKTVYIMKWK